MYFKASKYIFVALNCLILNPVMAAGVPPMVVGPCISCHGPQGASVGPATPIIAGMSDRRFIESMEEYRDDERPSTIMGRIAKGYTDNDFKVMASYFAKQRFVRYPQKVDDIEKVKRGKKRHKKYCEKCHENEGFSNEDSILAGQWMPYLQFSLADFQAGSRDMPRRMQKRLQKMVQKYGEESLDDLKNFYGSQN